ncbi:hypothetical protein GBO17_11525 [Mycobacterium avium subsp. hominissuis]|uniref:hypothetical protein n=1 Tax=Mycobacterium avium TaxID=1764 RepID=UPI001CC45AB5|nr:hypothetical protein [Mycobacterium avium]MBZ4559364.1 hypothetical protein [Mycobacterium avium subsp. hominissuis]MBZ4569098.1 hypothetical protein [Mycobacterium avium subsp. hominissuis]MBZ4587263.1 hypothetical protein [Mycobacterium avium subsp. hominissuis]MBZ4626251.1 hypothetical protein [Mycobacterium avium subsp. hominissuis]
MTQGHNREIDELVDIAANEKSPEADRRLFSALRGVELFFSRTTVEQDGKQVNATPLLRLSDGTDAMMLYTSKDHPDLSNTFAGGAFEDALEAAFSMPDLDWVIICNSASHWVAVDKRQIPRILDELGSRRDGFSYNPVTGEDALEDQITRAVGTPPEELSPPIGSLLRGREIFVELADDQAEDGQPIMKTFTIQQMPRVIRAYTTRTRPGIRYGGMQWEALKNMISAAPELDGIQIVNKADDWVVFDRESLQAGRTA